MAIARSDVAGWILRTRPDLWDIDAARAAGATPVPFALQRTYRTGIVAEGDPVFLWAAGRAGGIVAAGVVTAAVAERVEPRLWRDGGRGAAVRPYIDVRLDFLTAPVASAAVAGAHALARLEVLHVPRAPNPSVVTAPELAALRELVAASPSAGG